MDSTDCHDNAATCIEMTNRATERREQAMLFEAARSWMMLAWELESDPDLRDAVKDVHNFKRRTRFQAKTQSSERTADAKNGISGQL